MTRVKLESIFNWENRDLSYVDVILATLAETKGKQEVRRDKRKEIVEFIVGESEGERNITDIIYREDLLVRVKAEPTFVRGMMTSYPGDSYSVETHRAGILNGISKDYDSKGVINSLSSCSNGDEIVIYYFNHGWVKKFDWQIIKPNGECKVTTKLTEKDINILRLNAPEIKYFRV
jgi:hypothetical protein